MRPPTLPLLRPSSTVMLFLLLCITCNTLSRCSLTSFSCECVQGGKIHADMRHGEEDVVGVGTGGGSGHWIGGLKSYCIQYCDTFQTQNFSPTFLQPSEQFAKSARILKIPSPKFLEQFLENFQNSRCRTGPEGQFGNRVFEKKLFLKTGEFTLFPRILLSTKLIA